MKKYMYVYVCIDLDPKIMPNDGSKPTVAQMSIILHIFGVRVYDMLYGCRGRLRLPAAWCGLRDEELSKVAGIEGAVASGFSQQFVKQWPVRLLLLGLDHSLTCFWGPGVVFLSRS